MNNAIVYSNYMSIMMSEFQNKLSSLILDPGSYNFAINSSLFACPRAKISRYLILSKLIDWFLRESVTNIQICI